MRTSLAIDELAAHHALSTLPEVWVDLVHGHLSAEAAAAAVEGSEDQALIERSLALFEPPSTEDEQRRLEGLLAAHFGAPVRRIVPRWLIGSLTAAAAAVLLLLVLPREPEAFDGGYALSLSPGYLEDRAQPAASEAVVRYRAGQRIELRLRPQEGMTATVDAEVFAVTGGVGTRLTVEPKINEHGVVVLAGTTEALGLSEGRWQLVVVVGPPEHLPHALEDVRYDDRAPYDVQTAEVEIMNARGAPSQ